MKASVLDYVEFFFDFQNSFIPNYLAQRNPCIPFRLFQGYTPADCFMLRARSLTLDSALPKIWLRFTIFAKLFHSVWFSFLWSFLRKLFYLGLRSVRNYATGFHNFLQNYFTPFSSSQSGKANCESAVAH